MFLLWIQRDCYFVATLDRQRDRLDTMAPVDNVQIRPAQPSDLGQLAPLLTALWPESPAEEHAEELRLLLGGNSASVLTMPLTIFVAEASDGRLVGFVEVDLRSHADGCNPSQPVGYIEGWYVAKNYRERGVGRKLLAEAEQWARSHECVEMASDALIENELSQRAHAALATRLLTAVCTIGKAFRNVGLDFSRRN